MSQPTFPTQPSPAPEGTGYPPSVPAPETPPPGPVEPVAVPPVEMMAVPPTEMMAVPPTVPVTAPAVESDTVPKAELFTVPPIAPIQPEAALPSPPQPTPWPDSQPGNPYQTTPSQPPYAPDQPYAPAPGQQPYASGQPYPPTPGQQPYAPNQPYMPSQPAYTPDQLLYAAGQPYMGQPYDVGGQPLVTPPKKKKTWLIALIIVLAVLLVGGGAFFAYWHSTMRDDGIRGGRPEDGPVAAGQAKTAQAAVRGYLQALAAGNSAEALSFAAAPIDSTFLTDEVLAASLDVNPITFQQAVREDLSATDYILVTADYQIGSQSVTAIYETTQRDGYYYIENVTASISLYGIYVPDIGMRLNGASLDTGTTLLYVDLFPGSYQLTIGNSMLTLTGGQFVVTDPMDFPDLYDTTVELAADTPGQLANAATQTFDGCMAETTLTSNCVISLPIVMSDGKIRDVDPNSIVWSFIYGSSDFSSADFQYDPQNKPTVATAQVDLKVRRTMDGEGDDAQYIFYLCYDISSVRVNFSNPDRLDVSFTSTGDTDCPSPQR